MHSCGDATLHSAHPAFGTRHGFQIGTVPPTDLAWRCDPLPQRPGRGSHGPCTPAATLRCIAHIQPSGRVTVFRSELFRRPTWHGVVILCLNVLVVAVMVHALLRRRYAA